MTKCAKCTFLLNDKVRKVWQSAQSALFTKSQSATFTKLQSAQSATFTKLQSAEIAIFTKSQSAIFTQSQQFLLNLKVQFFMK